MENEFDILIRRMEKNLEMRHTYLMFAFTTSFAAIAALFVIDFVNMISWICIAPFVILICFQARISYARLTHAKMSAYVAVFYPERFSFQEKAIDELSGPIGKIISIISNYELTLLTLVVDVLVVIFKTYVLKDAIWNGVEDLSIIVATLLIFVLATYTYSYKSFFNKYKQKYKQIG